MNEIRCKQVLFYSRGDEESFFVWAKSIPHVENVHGEIDEIVLSLAAGEIPYESLRELIGLLYRYGIPMLQLAAFETEENTVWFRNTESYWYPHVFGSKSTSNQEQSGALSTEA